jgi:hypothetical protein
MRNEIDEQNQAEESKNRLNLGDMHHRCLYEHMLDPKIEGQGHKEFIATGTNLRGRIEDNAWYLEEIIRRRDPPARIDLNERIHHHHRF